MNARESFPLVASVVLLLPSLASAELGIIGLTKDGTLTWTNSYTNAHYQVEATTLAGHWLAVSNLSIIQGPDHQVSTQIQPLLSFSLYRVVWTDAPPAQPVGTWVYHGCDPSGALVVTGLVSITTSNPLSGMCVFQSVSPAPKLAHPVGSAGFSGGVLETPNKLSLPFGPTAFLKDNFALSGQMVMDEYWGYWSYTDYWISLNGPGGPFQVSGRFSARRQH